MVPFPDQKGNCGLALVLAASFAGGSLPRRLLLFLGLPAVFGNLKQSSCQLSEALTCLWAFCILYVFLLHLIAERRTA